MTHKEAEGALWLAWLDRARLSRAARGEEDGETNEAFEKRERLGFRRWLTKNRQTLPGFAKRGSRTRPLDPEVN